MIPAAPLCKTRDSAAIAGHITEEKMERKEVSSSMIKSVGHDAQSNTMEVEFKNGKIYTYPATAEEHRALMESESIGAHFNQHFKGRK